MFKNELLVTPSSSGCYIMKDSSNKVIYVGKAKNLKKRLSSYFNKAHSGKTHNLVNNIDHFEYIVTNTEKEALLLELSLIKQYNPKYNILLKDDKSYPYIELTKEQYPKLNIVRNIKMVKNKNRLLFGPYPNAYAARKVVELLNNIYPLRKCRTLKKEVCLYYHINQCLGYCAKKVDTDKIDEISKEIISFLNGNFNDIKNKLTNELEQSIKKLNFEKSMEIKEMLDYINSILNKQKIEFLDNDTKDIISYYIDKGYISIQVFHVRGGKITERDADLFVFNGNTEDILVEYIARLYENNLYLPKYIILPNILKDNIELLKSIINTNIVIPIKGDKKIMLDLVSKNAEVALYEKFELAKLDDDKYINSNNELANILNIKNLTRIEIFDISNIFGEYNVAGMVVFINGIPMKKEYRKYKISIDKNDDYNSMKEVLYRRYFRLLSSGSVMPDLIIVDGGKNQINAALEIINSLKLNIKVCGLAKDDKHRTSNLMNDKLELIDIDKTSNLFYLLTRIQDEVHKYTINYHRTIRSKGLISSQLDNIKGLGETRKKLLIKKFGSITKIKEKSIEELSNVIPIKVAINIYNYFNEKDLNKE